MNFSEYLKSKKIDSVAFRKSESENFSILEGVFNQVQPDSFTQQKLYLINPLRRKYKLSEEQEAKKPKPAPMRPKISKPKI